MSNPLHPLTRLGFTLVELLVVLIVISALIGFTTVRVTQAVDSAKAAGSKAGLENAFKSAQSYWADQDQDYGVSSDLVQHITDDGLAAVAIGSEGASVGEGIVGVFVYAGGASVYMKTRLPDGNYRWVRDAGSVMTRGVEVVTPVLNVAAISAGAYFSCAVAEGKSFCWGRNADGTLGNSSSISAQIPVATTMSGALAGQTILKVAAGSNNTCAVASARAYCWGAGISGQLGHGLNANALSPVAVSTVSGDMLTQTVTDITTGAGGDYACAVAGGKAYCWGDDTNGRLGNGASGSTNTPQAVDASGVLSGRTVTAISAGRYHTCAIADGRPFCWGQNGWGELGNGAGINQQSPVATNVSGALSGRTATSISAGTSYTCVVASGGAICWGRGGGTSSPLGTGGLGDASSPALLGGALAGRTVTDIAASVHSTVGMRHTCAVADGNAYCWGSDSSGALGTNSGGNTLIPVAVNTSGVLSGKVVTDISANESTTCAVADAEAYCWGGNTFGQLGRSGTVASPVAVKVRQDAGVLAR